MKIINKNKWPFFLLVWQPFVPAVAENFCFLQAETPYEQDYCTLQAEGARNLPEFYSFRKNEPRMQHLLLKPYARKLGITITPPPRQKVVSKHPFAKSATANRQKAYKRDVSAQAVPERHQASAPARLRTPVKGDRSPVKLVMQPVRQAADELSAPQIAAVEKLDKNISAKTSPRKILVEKIRPAMPISLANCKQQRDSLVCHDKLYRLRRNRHNKNLDAAIFEPGNRLGFSTLLSSVVDKQMVNGYLMKNYELYLAGMDRIGLIEASMGFQKFQRLFHHIRQAGADFPARFETMYHYLKKDKKVLAVKVGSEIPVIRPADCLLVGKSWLSCQAGKHYVFRLEK